MATVQKRRGKWRVQIRRNGHALSRTFHRKTDADEWARQAEHGIDKEIDPSTKRISGKDTFASLIDLHIDDLQAVGKPLRRSKEYVLERLREELGGTPLTNLTRERIILYGRQRAKAGAGPATLAVDISFIGTVLTHAAAVHGVAVNTEAVRLARVALRRLGLVGAPRERERRPSEKELERLFAYFDANERLTIPMTRVVKFAVATAMRIDEIFRIEWTTLDARTRTILVSDRKDPRKKDGNDQRVPLLAVTGYDACARSNDTNASFRDIEAFVQRSAGD
ncbi:MAG: tyrosine-type recombinase/integrase [Pseudomonadota bacterium]